MGDKKMAALNALKYNGKHCPHCFSHDISGGSCDVIDTNIYQEISCNLCESHWEDTYDLAGFVSLRDKDGELIGSNAVNLREILLNIIKKKELLPLLIGVHEDLDHIIEDILRNDSLSTSSLMNPSKLMGIPSIGSKPSNHSPTWLRMTWEGLLNRIPI